MRKLFMIVCAALVFVACGDKQEQSKEVTQEVEKQEQEQKQCELKVFGANPALTVMLEILYPEGLIGLNYKPYPEDIPFMPEGTAELPILGHTGKNLNFEEIASLKPDVIFFADNTLDSVIEPYAKIGIEAVKVPLFSYEQSAEAIRLITETLSKDSQCEEIIAPRAQNLLNFLQESNEILAKAQQDLQSHSTESKEVQPIHLDEVDSADSKTIENLNHTHRPSVYFAQGFDGLKTQCSASEDKKDLAYQIGGVNAISCDMISTEQQTQIDFELLAKVNPQVIFVREIPLFKELLENPNEKWQALNALQNKKVFYAPSTPSNWLMRPPSIMQNVGLVWAYSKIHPELISDEVAKTHAQKFYEIFLEPLSDEEYYRLQGL